MRPATELEHRIAGIAALDQPLRRNLYRLLSERDAVVEEAHAEADDERQGRRRQAHRAARSRARNCRTIASVSQETVARL